MKRLMVWLIAIAAAFVLVWGVRNYFMRRIFFQPEWYEQQKQAGVPLQPSPWSQPDSREPGRKIRTTAADVAAESVQPGIPPPQPRPGGTVTSLGGSSPEAPATRSTHSQTRLEKILREEGSVRIAAGDLVPLFIDQMRGEDDFDPYTVIRGAKSTLTPGQVTVEMILDVNAIPAERLTPDGVRVLDEIRKLVPGKYLHEVYVKATLLPQVRGDEIEFAGNSSISIGRISLPFSELKKRFNIQPRIDLHSFLIRDMEIENGYLVLIK